MAQQVSKINWARCEDEVECIGERVPPGRYCLAHAVEQDPHGFEARLKAVRDGRIDARGVPISTDLLRRLLAEAPKENGHPLLKIARFRGARFMGEADFSAVRFAGTTNFRYATFSGWAWFHDAQFREPAHFRGTVFEDRARFSRSTFHKVASFPWAEFHGRAGFRGVRYLDDAIFTQATFRQEAGFGRDTLDDVEGQDPFEPATFNKLARFNDVTFGEATRFDGVTFSGDVDFSGATFEHTKQLGPSLAVDKVILDRTDFHQRIRIEFAANIIYAQRAQFRTGVQLWLRWASVVLDDADFSQPSSLIGVSAFSNLDEHPLRKFHAGLPASSSDPWLPRLVSLQRADLAGLRLTTGDLRTNVDLRACRFAGARNLDKFRMEGDPEFENVPPDWWRTRRRTLAEEQEWRHCRDPDAGWYPETSRPPAHLQLPKHPKPEPIQVAGLYRELRKGREDAKDAPGAAEFYYGEMEMRRHAAPLWSPERLLLTLYWLVSGYALRAWRAFTALLLAVVIAATIFATVGFRPPDSPRFVPIGVSSTGTLLYEGQEVQQPSFREQFPGALGYSAETATSLLRGPLRVMTPIGEWTQAILRWLGPLLFGLALLSLRGRVKR